MKYKTFRGLVIAGSVVMAGGLGYLGIRSCSGRSEPPVPGTPQTAPAERPSTPASVARPSASIATESAPGTMPLRDLDRAVLELAKTPLQADKKKDALPGRPFKVNLYQDPGSATPNRVKIDLDRNEKWDEKWEFDPDGKVTRQVAPADDEQYSEEWRLDGGQWINPALKAGAAARSAEAPPVEAVAAASGEGMPLRPFDAEVIALGDRSLPGDKVKDALPGRPFKVNLYQDAGMTRVNRLKLDLDRDDRWDEKWTFVEENGRREVKRQVAPADDEQYTEDFRLRAGRWVKQ